MAVLSAVYHSSQVVSPDMISRDHVQVIEVLCHVSGTYLQADRCKLSNVLSTLAAANTVPYGTSVLLGAMPGTASARDDGTARPLSLIDVAVSGDDITFGISDNVDLTTELANSTVVPTQFRPFRFMIAAKRPPRTAY